MQGQERVHHVNFLRPHQRGVQHFSLPEYSENSGKCISITLSTHVETVVKLVRKTPDAYIDLKVDMDELDLTASEAKATYEEIKQYILDKYDTKVSNLYIAQVKEKYSIIERENYNKPKSENAKQPQCPPEKVEMIKDALKHFKMI